MPKKAYILLTALLLFLSFAQSVHAQGYDYVDNNTSDVDGVPDTGTQINFVAQQQGPDSVYDTMTEASGGGFVLSVEELSVDLSTAQTSNTGTLTEASDTTQAVPFATRYATTAGGTIDAHASILTDISVSGTTVIVARGSTGSKAISTTMYWVEFGSPINVYSGTFSVASGTTSGTANIGVTVTLTQSFLVFYYQASGTTADHAHNAIRGYFSNASQLTFERTTSDTGSLSGHWWVVEDTGSNFEVDTVNIQLAGVASNTGSFSAVTMASTMVVASYEGGRTDDIIHGGVSVYLSSTTQITAVRGGTSGTIDVTAYVIEFSGDTSVQRGDISYTSTDTSLSDPITEVTLDDAMAWIPTGWINTGHCTSGGTGSSDNLDVIIRVRLTSSTQITGDRNNNGANDAVLRWEVVGWETYGGSEDYQLDLEVQWIDATHDLPNAELCIYGGTMGSEDIRVDAWTGAAWQNLFTDLTSGWNNVSITDVLVGSTFTIRFRGGTETGDSSQDSWQIDAALLHVWGAPPIALFSFAPSSPYTGETVAFNASASSDPDGSIVSYFWTFGDGTNGTGEIITHTYTDNGIYTATLIVTDNDGLVDIAFANLTVLNRPPVVSFTESAETAFTGEPVYFNASATYDSDGSVVSYLWSFGDGSNATAITAQHSYADDGTYTVTLTVTDDDGAVASTTATKTILNRVPVGMFTESGTTVYTGENVQFNASASYDPDGSIVSYIWTFGDGVNATGLVVSHAYADNGSYTVTLTVTDDDGSTSSETATKMVLNRSPVAVFTESTETVETGEAITYNGSSSYDIDGTIVSYFWVFGDGANATGTVASHAYMDNGVYAVTLTVTDDDGAIASTSATKTVFNRPPTAFFTESLETVYTDEILNFNGSASYDPDGFIVGYFWDFGDGSNATGVFAAHVYIDNGVYNVTLTVTDDDGATDTVSSTKTVANRSPVASFTESAETAYIGEPITFNASGSYDPDGEIASFYWDLGDATNATGPIVSHAYSVNGTFTVVLTVTDNDGSSNSTSATKTILHNNPPVASFTESTATAYTADTITFNASSSYDSDGSIVNYFWDFGDGTNASGVTVSHAYAEDGVYTTTLTVTDDNGATATATANKTILNRLPIASFTESATVVLTSEVVHFNATGSYDPDGTIVNYFWSLGDGTNATDITVTHSYLDNGTYTVTLTVTDNDGETASVSATKTVVNRSPVASFTESATSVHTSEPITFDATASYDPDGSIFSYTWDFGDGNITTVTNPVVAHAYADNGTYTVTLTVTDDDGATAASNATKTVLNRPPLALFIESAATVLTGDIIQFNASSSYDPDGMIVSYFWDFGDGTNSTGIVVQHYYSDNGVYAVTLSVIDNDGATASATATKTVLNRPPVASFTESATTVVRDEIIYFNASASYDPDGTIAGHYWDFGDGTNATGVTVAHAYADSGVYMVMLTITDDDGATTSTSATKTVEITPPVAVFDESSETVYTGEVITFNASSSYDPDGFIVGYFWDFGDGANASGLLVQHAYPDNGAYTVSLTVTDDDGASDTATSTKTVLNQPPVAIFTESTETASTLEPIYLNASQCYDLDGTIVSYFWDFGDETNVTGVIVSHVYADNGVYVVTLTVTDDDGETGSASSTKTVLNRPPTATFIESAETALTGETIAFDASSSYDPDGSITNYFWTFGDGTNATGISVNHVYADDGTYTVTLTVTDDDGATDSVTSTKTLLNRPPIALFTESAETVYTNAIIQFNASSSYDSDGFITSYFWAFGDGINTTGVAVTHAYAQEGIYTVTLVVTDNDGGFTTVQATKTILGGVPDIKIVDVIPANTEIYKHRVLDISVVVTNEGEGGAETFNVTLFFSEVHGWHLVEVDGHLVWCSGIGNSADFLLQTSTTIPASNPTLTFETKYDVESLYDFCFVQISTDEGATWVSLENAYTTHDHEDTEPDIIANLPGLSGTSTNWPEWRTMSFDLSAYAGQAVMLGFRYMTDSAYAKEGWHVDNVALNGAVIPNQDFTQQIPPPLNHIQTLSVNDLGPNTQRTLVFSVNTTSIPAGKYSVSALAGPVQAEIDTEDNFYGDGVVEVMANPDVDGDGDVDIFDVVAIASLYGCKEGDARWNPAVDLVEDKVINIYDIVAVASHYGEQIP